MSPGRTDYKSTQFADSFGHQVICICVEFRALRRGWTVWPPFASLYASSAFENLLWLASPSARALLESMKYTFTLVSWCELLEILVKYLTNVNSRSAPLPHKPLLIHFYIFTPMIISFIKNHNKAKNITGQRNKTIWCMFISGLCGAVIKHRKLFRCWYSCKGTGTWKYPAK